jgi:DNA-binding LytR/AlgR family response regulator
MENPHKIAVPLLGIKTAKGIKFISLGEILFIRADRKHSIIYFSRQEKISTHNLLKWYEQNLPEPQFYRCHDSFIVNCAHIDCICGTRFILNDNFEVSISRKRRFNALQSYELFVQSRHCQSF